MAALGVVLVALGSLLGCSWPFLFVLGAVLSDLGRSWGGLGRSSAALRRSWGGLGAVWGRLGGAKNVVFPLVFHMFLQKRCLE